MFIGLSVGFFASLVVGFGVRNDSESVGFSVDNEIGNRVCGQVYYNDKCEFSKKIAKKYNSTQIKTAYIFLSSRLCG